MPNFTGDPDGPTVVYADFDCPFGRHTFKADQGLIEMAERALAGKPPRPEVPFTFVKVVCIECDGWVKFDSSTRKAARSE